MKYILSRKLLFYNEKHITISALDDKVWIVFEAHNYVSYTLVQYNLNIHQFISYRVDAEEVMKLKFGTATKG